MNKVDGNFLETMSYGSPDPVGLIINIFEERHFSMSEINLILEDVKAACERLARIPTLKTTDVDENVLRADLFKGIDRRYANCIELCAAQPAHDL